MFQKLRHMSVNPEFVQWVHYFLNNRNQYLKIDNIITTNNRHHNKHRRPSGLCVLADTLSSVHI